MSLPVFSTQAELFSTAGLLGSLLAETDRYRLFVSFFRLGEYWPPRLRDVARAALHAEGTSLSVFLGLSDEGLACEGGSFVRPGDEAILARLEAFNRAQDYGLLRAVLAVPKA